MQEKHLTQQEIDTLVDEFRKAVDPVRIMIREDVPEDARIDHCGTEFCIVVSDDVNDFGLVGEKCYRAVWDCLFAGRIGSHGIAPLVQPESAFSEEYPNSLVRAFLAEGRTVYEK